MYKDMIFGIVGGLGLFLFGMELLSDGLKKTAGPKVRQLLSSLTKNRIIAIFVGTFVTCLIQSSSATTVMVVGFVNASLLTLRQALCLVLGANIGTTFTAWLVSITGFSAFKITTYALPAVGLGLVLRMFAKTQKKKNIGLILIGFGILFTGIDFMKGSFDPLKDSEAVHNFLIYMGDYPILAVLAGAAVTMLLQSSSATIAILQILALQGAFGDDWPTVFRVVIPFVLGDNIGTTITAEIASLRTSLAARQTAHGHTLFNVIGVCYMLPLVWLGLYPRFIDWITPFELTRETIMVYIAVSHSVFNVINSLVWLPMVGVLERIVVRCTHKRKSDALAATVRLEANLMGTPEIAIDQAKHEIERMTGIARDAVSSSIDGLLQDNRKQLEAARKGEDVTDTFQYEITSYLATLSQQEISGDISRELPVLLHSVNDIERIGDHAVNIVEIAERKIGQKIAFSDKARKEIESIRNEVVSMFNIVVESLETGNVHTAMQALKHEEKLNFMQIEFRRNHVKRMTRAQCTPQSGLIFIDLIDNVEKIGDHLTNIAQSVIGGLHWDHIEPGSENEIQLDGNGNGNNHVAIEDTSD